MNWGRVLSETLLGVVVLVADVAYMAFDVPLDGLIDVREAVLSLAGLAAGCAVVAKAWGRVLWRLVVVLAKDVLVFLEVAGGRTVRLFGRKTGKRRKDTGSRPRRHGKDDGRHTINLPAHVVDLLKRKLERTLERLRLREG